MVFSAPAMSSGVNVRTNIVDTWTDAAHQEKGVTRREILEAARTYCSEMFGTGGLIALNADQPEGVVSLRIQRAGTAARAARASGKWGDDLVWSQTTLDSVVRPGIAIIELQCLLAGLGKYMESDGKEAAHREWSRFSSTIVNALDSRNAHMVKLRDASLSEKDTLKKLTALVRKCIGSAELQTDVVDPINVAISKKALQPELVQEFTTKYNNIYISYQAFVNDILTALRTEDPTPEEVAVVTSYITNMSDFNHNQALVIKNAAASRKAAKAVAAAKAAADKINAEMAEIERAAAVTRERQEKLENAKKIANAAQQKIIELELESNRQKQALLDAQAISAANEQERIKQAAIDAAAKQRDIDEETQRLKDKEAAATARMACLEACQAGLDAMETLYNDVMKEVENMRDVIQERYKDTAKTARFQARAKEQVEDPLDAVKDLRIIEQGDCQDAQSTPKWALKIKKYSEACHICRAHLVSLNETYLNAVRIYVCIQPLLPHQLEPSPLFEMLIDGPEGQKYLMLDLPSGKKLEDVKQELTTGSSSIRQDSMFGPFYDVIKMPPLAAKRLDGDEKADVLFLKAKTMVDQILSGFQLIMFGYGYSGSGKTWALLKAEGSNGLVQSCVKHLTNSDKGTGCGTKTRVTLHEIFEVCLNDLINQATPPQVNGVTGKIRGSLQHANNDVTIYKAYETLVTEFNTSNATVQKLDQLMLAITEIRSPTQTEGIKDIDAVYKTLGTRTIRPTSNNPDSSRSHLFVVLKVVNLDTNSENAGYLTICDMGGRENPQEIYNEAKVSALLPVLGTYAEQTIDLTAGAKWEFLSLMSRPASLTFSKNFESFGNEPVRGKLPALRNLLAIPKSDAIFQIPFQHVKPTYYMMSVQTVALMHYVHAVREGLFINESVNHFKYYIQKQNGGNVDDLSVAMKLSDRQTKYNPAQCFTAPTMDKTEPKNPVRMIPTLMYLSDLVRQECVNYAMYACIRSDRTKRTKVELTDYKAKCPKSPDAEEFTYFSRMTLGFARDISSSKQVMHA